MKELCLLLLFAPFQGHGEIPGSDVKILKKNTHLAVSQIGKDISITEQHFVEKEFYKNFDRNSGESIYYSDFDQLKNFSASTFTPFKSKYKETKVTSTEVSDIVQPGIFYGGYKRLDFVFPTLTSGSIGRMKYEKVIMDPHIIAPFYFTENEEVTEAVYSVTFPRDMKINYKIFGPGGERLTFSETSDKEFITYAWKGSDFQAHKRERNSPSFAFTALHIVIYIESYQYKGDTFEVLSEVSDLYNWYTGLTAQIDYCDQNKIRDLVKEIIPDRVTKLDSISAIYKWVQKHVKYVAFEDGMAGFIPRNACDVVNKRYGDCKDMANLLKELLTSVNIDAHLTWIGTRSKPYSYKTLPSTVADNHMICSVKSDGQYLFLDATNPYGTFGYPTSMIQGKEALIGVSAKTFELVEVPILDPQSNCRRDYFKCQLNDNGLSGYFYSTLTGYKKDDIELTKLKAEVRNETEYLRDHFLIGNNNIAIHEASLQGFGTQSDTARVSFLFHLPDYSRQVGNKVYLNLNLNRELPGEKFEAGKRLNPLEEDYKYVFESVISVGIPENYRLSYLPKDKDFTWGNNQISVSYKVSGNEIIYTKKYMSKFLYLFEKDFNSWNESIETITTINQESIILEME